MNILKFIDAWETGDLDDDYETVIAGFQMLIDTGIAWQLQGCYGRMAKKLIEKGYCTPPSNIMGFEPDSGNVVLH